MSLTDYLTNIANAIRNKKGTSDKINAQDFASEIENLPSGGVDDKTSYEQGYEDGSADALKDVTTLKGYLDIAKSTANSFANYTGTSVEGLIKYDDTSEVTNMNSMFYSCTNLITIPLLNTSKVTRMDSMFFNCTKLTTIPALNTSNVTDMNSMFYYCTNLITIPALDTSKVTNMAQMFTVCSSLTTIPLLNTSKVTRMDSMFFNCTKLTTIPALNTSNVTKMNSMFYYCTNLTTIPALDTSNVTSTTRMFQGCSNLKSILMYGMKVSFDISSSTQFEASDLVTILNNLATVTSTQTLTMGATNLAKLTDEQKAIATNKGWTLA